MGMKLLLSVLKRNEEPYVREKNRSWLGNGATAYFACAYKT